MAGNNSHLRSKIQEALKDFADKPLAAAATGLFDALGYPRQIESFQ